MCDRQADWLGNLDSTAGSCPGENFEKLKLKFELKFKLEYKDSMRIQ